MTRDEALHLIGASPTASLDEIDEKHREAVDEARVRLDAAPSAHLRKLFAKKLKELESARDVIDRVTDDSEFYPGRAPREQRQEETAPEHEISEQANRDSGAGRPQPPIRLRDVPPREMAWLAWWLMRRFGRAILRPVLSIAIGIVLIGIVTGGMLAWQALFGDDAAPETPVAASTDASDPSTWLFLADYRSESEERRPAVFQRVNCSATYRFQRSDGSILNTRGGLLMTSAGDRCMAGATRVTLPDEFLIEARACPDIDLMASDLLDSIAGNYRGTRSRYEFWLGDRPAGSLEFALRNDGAWSLRRTARGTTRVLANARPSGAKHSTACVTLGIQARAGLVELWLNDSLVVRQQVDGIPRDAFRLGTEGKARFERVVVRRPRPAPN